MRYFNPVAFKFKITNNNEVLCETVITDWSVISFPFASTNLLITHSEVGVSKHSFKLTTSPKEKSTTVSTLLGFYFDNLKHTVRHLLFLTCLKRK